MAAAPSAEAKFKRYSLRWAKGFIWAAFHFLYFEPWFLPKPRDMWVDRTTIEHRIVFKIL